MESMMHALLLMAGLAAPLFAGASSAEPVVYERPRVLVWELSRAGTPPKVAEAVEASVTRWAAKNPHLEVIGHADLKELLEAESSRLALGNEDDGRLQTIAAKADAALVVFGQISKVGEAYDVSLALFDARMARAVRRDHVKLVTLEKLDQQLGRAANALVGRVIDRPALDLRQAAAELVDQLPKSAFVASKKVTVVAPLRYGTSPFSSTFGEQAAAEVAGALRRRFNGKMQLKPGLRLEGTYLPNHDMVELALGVIDDHAQPREVARAQQRLIRGTVDEDGLVPARIGEEERRRVMAQTATGSGQAITVDAWTEKGSLDVMFTEDETFHVFMKVSQPGYVRLIYEFADETKVLMEDAWPITDDQVGEVVRYHAPFGPAPPFGVERIYVQASKLRPVPLKIEERSIDGMAYNVVPDSRGFVTNPRGSTTITITTTGR